MFSVLSNLNNHVDILTVGRQTAYKHGYLQMEQLRKEGMTFIVSAGYEFPLPKHETPGCCGDLTVKSSLLNLHDTGFTTVGALELNGMKLSSGFLTYAYIDKTNRRRSVLPQWFMENFFVFKNHVPHFTMNFAEVRYSFLKNYDVSKDDIDHFGHTNHSVYLREAVKHAAELMALENTPVKKVALQYKRESNLGDRLNICSWFEPMTPECHTFWSTVTKDENWLTRVKLEFYTKSYDSKL